MSAYDHWVRNEREFHRIVAYIEENPVSAGLAATPEDWPWSSAGTGKLKHAPPERRNHRHESAAPSKSAKLSSRALF